MATRSAKAKGLVKSPTGISGFDALTKGGLPKGRITLLSGDAGSGKTVFGLQFLANGASRFDEPGVFVCFEETASELLENAASLDLGIAKLLRAKKIRFVEVPTGELVSEVGEYDLEGLLTRIELAIETIGAKRLVLDSLDALFGALSNRPTLRKELNRLFRWLRAHGATTLTTGERREASYSRTTLQEHIADCVVIMDNRLSAGISGRQLRVVKYRGSSHGTNEYPFTIDSKGIHIDPITSRTLSHSAPTQRISSGISGLDAMLGGKGYFRGASVLVSGEAGAGKTTVAAHLVAAACNDGKRCIYFAFEESPKQIIRNMRSVGTDLRPHLKGGLLEFHAVRPSQCALEWHLDTMQQRIADLQPEVVVIDPISSLISIAPHGDVCSMLVRVVDSLKVRGITALMTNLTSAGAHVEGTDVGVSSVMDTWIALRNVEANGERNRLLHILKSRGMAHSNQVREFCISSDGVNLVDVHVGPTGVLTGRARIMHEEQECQQQARNHQLREFKRLEVESKRRAIEAQTAAFWADHEAQMAAVRKLERDLEQAVQNDPKPTRAVGRKKPGSGDRKKGKSRGRK